MNINPIGQNLNILGAAAARAPRGVAEEPSQASSPGQESHKNAYQDLSPKEGCNSPVSSMSTEVYLTLLGQVRDDPFRNLDFVIAKMKENMEVIGDALEAINEMTKKTSKDKIALQVLTKTLEAMDEISARGEELSESGKRSSESSSFSCYA
jgi:hypothetical protein